MSLRFPLATLAALAFVFFGTAFAQAQANKLPSEACSKFDNAVLRRLKAVGAEVIKNLDPKFNLSIGKFSYENCPTPYVIVFSTLLAADILSEAAHESGIDIEKHGVIFQFSVEGDARQ